MTPRPYARVLEDGSVAIFDTKVVYVLAPAEIVLLLSSCRSLWIEAIRRGKRLKRCARTERYERSRESGQEGTRRNPPAEVTDGHPQT